MLAADVSDILKTKYNIDLLSLGFQIECAPLQSSAGFRWDQKNRKLIVNSNFMPPASLSHKQSLISSLIDCTTMQAKESLEDIFSVVCPNYKIETNTHFSLASCDNNPLMLFTNDNTHTKKQHSLLFISTKWNLHSHLRKYIFPIAYKKGVVKPVEYISSSSFKLIRNINKSLIILGHPDKRIYISKSGVVLEPNKQEQYIVCRDNGRYERGNKESKVFNEWMLFNRIMK